MTDSDNGRETRAASGPPRANAAAPPATVRPTRVVIMCAVRKKRLAQFDMVKMREAPEWLLALLSDHGLYQWCKYCKTNHRVDFARILTAEETLLWIGSVIDTEAGPSMPAPRRSGLSPEWGMPNGKS